MTTQNDNFTELKRAFDTQSAHIGRGTENGCDAIARILIKLLDDHSIREAEKIFIAASCLISQHAYNAKIKDVFSFPQSAL